MGLLFFYFFYFLVTVRIKVTFKIVVCIQGTSVYSASRSSEGLFTAECRVSLNAQNITQGEIPGRARNCAWWVTQHVGHLTHSELRSFVLSLLRAALSGNFFLWQTRAWSLRSSQYQVTESIIIMLLNVISAHSSLSSTDLAAAPH